MTSAYRNVFQALGEHSVKAGGLDRGYHGSYWDLEGDSVDPAVGRLRKQHEGKSSDSHVNYVTANPMPADLRHETVLMQEKKLGVGRGGDLKEYEPPTSDPVEADREAEIGAWKWANTGTYGPDVVPKESGGWDRLGRPRVHVGRAEGPVGADVNVGSNDKLLAFHQHGQAGWAMATSGTFRVEDTLWTPPPLDRSKGTPGVHGALAGLNWHQFGMPNVANPDDVAHGAADHMDKKILKCELPTLRQPVMERPDMPGPVHGPEAPPKYGPEQPLPKYEQLELG